MTSSIGWWPELSADFGLSVPVGIGMVSSGAVSGSAAFSLGVTVSLSMDGDAGPGVGDFGLSVPVGIGMDGAGISTADFGLSVPVGIGMAAVVPGQEYADFGLSVPVSVGMVGAEQYSADVGLSIPVGVGMVGAYVPPGVQVVGSAIARAATVSLPAHQSGDIFVMVATRDVTSSPSGGGSVPSWDSVSGSSYTYSAVATTSSHTSGNWGANSILAVVVLRGQSFTTPFGGYAEGFGDDTVSVSAPAITLADTSGSSALLHFVVAQYDPPVTWGSAPAGYTMRASQVYSAAFTSVAVMSKNDTTTDGSVNFPTTPANFLSITLEIRK